MTNEQKAWLDSHPEYRMMGAAGGNTRYVKRGTLRKDGTFVPVSRSAPLIDTRDGGFGVGVREIASLGWTLLGMEKRLQIRLPTGRWPQKKSLPTSNRRAYIRQPC